jgi:antitoxin CcdA
MMRMNESSTSRHPEHRAATRPTNLSLSAALVKEARELGVNISLAASSGLEQAVAKRRAERWVEENAAALDSYNAYVEKNGLPLERSRLF